MNVEQIFDACVCDESTLLETLRTVTMAQTFTLDGGMSLYPIPAYDEGEVEEDPNAPEEIIEPVHIGWNLDGEPDTENIEYGIVMGLAETPKAHIASPAFEIMYKSRLWYLDAYKTIAHLVEKSVMEAESNDE